MSARRGVVTGLGFFAVAAGMVVLDTTTGRFWPVVVLLAGSLGWVVLSAARVLAKRRNGGRQ